MNPKSLNLVEKIAMAGLDTYTAPALSKVVGSMGEPTSALPTRMVGAGARGHQLGPLTNRVQAQPNPRFRQHNIPGGFDMGSINPQTGRRPNADFVGPWEPQPMLGPGLPYAGEFPAGHGMPMPSAQVQLTSGLSNWGGVGLGAGIGAGVGFLNSDQGGGFQGAMKGAFGGALLGAGAGFGAPWAQRGLQSNSRFMNWLGPEYGSSFRDLGTSMNTTLGRSIAFGSGGLLGGVFMGGYRSKKRGFNKNRGNRI